MAKRFTDTDKWKRPWFDQLDIKGKLVWLYILDQCDHCGVWPANFKLLSTQVGFRVTRYQFEAWLSGKIKPFDGDKYFIPSFVTFQQGQLSETKNAHKPIFAFLAKTGFKIDEEMMASGCHQDPILMGPSIGIGIGKGEEGESEGKRTKFDFESLYQAYPRKEGKAEGMTRLEKRIKSQDEFDSFAKAVRKYASICKLEGRDKKFQLKWSSFVGAEGGERWLDYADSSATPAPSPLPDGVVTPPSQSSFQSEASQLHGQASEEMRERLRSFSLGKAGA